MSFSITIGLLIFYFFVPVVIIFLTKRSSFLKQIGAVVIAYIFGLILGNSGILPRASNSFNVLLEDKTHLPEKQVQMLFEEGVITSSDVLANEITGVQDVLIKVVILLAIPLLLFSLDMKKWLKLAGEAMLSMGLAMTALLISVFLGFYIFKDRIDESWKVSGMLIGLYTGGTPNLAAISAGLKVNANIFLLTNTYDMIIGAVCLVFLMTLAQRTFNLFLPSFSNRHGEISKENIETQNEDVGQLARMLNVSGIKELLKGFALALLTVAISGGISLIVPQYSQMMTVILSITTLGIFLSSFKKVNRIKGTFHFGMYFIIVFSLIVASMGNLSAMFHIDYLYLFSYVLLVVIGSIVIHVFLSYLFKVDSDTTIVTITALAFSPPFVPVVAGALKNKDIIISGLTVGIFGYVIGNYLGLAVAYLLKFQGVHQF